MGNVGHHGDGGGLTIGVNRGVRDLQLLDGQKRPTGGAKKTYYRSQARHEIQATPFRAIPCAASRRCRGGTCRGSPRACHSAPPIRMRHSRGPLERAPSACARTSPFHAQAVVLDPCPQQGLGVGRNGSCKAEGRGFGDCLAGPQCTGLTPFLCVLTDAHSLACSSIRTSRTALPRSCSGARGISVLSAPPLLSLASFQ